MWLLIPEGFYSIVKKSDDDRLCVRARVEEDLARLRTHFMPTLTETLETPGGDYRYRAWISRQDFARGMAEIAQRLDYGNFKNEVGASDPDRAQTYSHVWGILGQLQPGGPYST